MTATAVASEEPQRQPWTWMHPVPTTMGCTPTPQVWIVNTAGTSDYWWRINLAAGYPGSAVTFPGGHW